MLRQLTHIPQTGELTKVSDPIVTRLVRPETLQPATAEEWNELWGDE